MHMLGHCPENCEVGLNPTGKKCEKRREKAIEQTGQKSVHSIPKQFFTLFEKLEGNKGFHERTEMFVPHIPLHIKP